MSIWFKYFIFSLLLLLFSCNNLVPNQTEFQDIRNNLLKVKGIKDVKAVDDTENSVLPPGYAKETKGSVCMIGLLVGPELINENGSIKTDQLKVEVLKKALPDKFQHCYFYFINGLPKN